MKIKKLGQILIEFSLISQERLELALKKQIELKNKGQIEFLGQILIDMKFIETHTLSDILKKQEYLRNDNWFYTAFHFIEVLGDERWQESYRKVKELQKEHIFEILHQLGYMSFDVQKKFIYDVFKPLCDNVLLGDLKKLKATHTPGIFEQDGEFVNICFVPQKDFAHNQAIVTYLDYKKLTGDVKIGIHQEYAIITAQNGTSSCSFRDIFDRAITLKASDIHILYKEEEYNVFFRIYGVLKRMPEFTHTIESGNELIKAIKILAADKSIGKFNSDESRIPQDAVIELDEHELRLVFIPDGKMSRTEVTIRIHHSKILSASDLKTQGYFEDDIKIFLKASRRRGGLNIISGITNSGKTTFVSHIITQIHDKKVETVEDPIEFKHSNNNVISHQIYMPKDENVRVGYLEYVNAFKRADPDVIFVGELRNNKHLVESVIEAAEAGQCIYTTVHITSAFNVYHALEEVFKIPFYLSVNKIILSENQVLVHKLCPHCKTEDVDFANYKALNDWKADLPYKIKDSIELLKNSETFLKGDGCEFCNCGYADLTPVYEYFYPDVDFIQWLIDSKPSRFEIEQKAIETKRGKNKLQIFVQKILNGEIDCGISNIEKII